MLIKSKIILSNIWQWGKTAQQTRVVLSQRSVCESADYVSGMVEKLQRMLERAEERVADLGAPDEQWNSRSVSEIALWLAVQDKVFLERDPRGWCPSCLREVDYVWNVYLHPMMGLYDIQGLKVVCDEPCGGVKRLVEVLWAGEPE